MDQDPEPWEVKGLTENLLLLFWKKKKKMDMALKPNTYTYR